MTVDRNIDPYEYNNHDQDCMGGPYSGDKCPNCGKCLKYDEEGVMEDGTRGDVMDLAPEDLGKDIWCKSCWAEVKNIIKGYNNHSLEEFV